MWLGLSPPVSGIVLINHEPTPLLTTSLGGHQPHRLGVWNTHQRISAPKTVPGVKSFASSRQYWKVNKHSVNNIRVVYLEPPRSDTMPRNRPRGGKPTRIFCNTMRSRASRNCSTPHLRAITKYRANTLYRRGYQKPYLLVLLVRPANPPTARPSQALTIMGYRQ